VARLQLRLDISPCDTRVVIRILPGATPLAAALLWVAALAVDPGPYGTAALLLIGIGVLVMAAVSVIGLVLVGGRWARRLALATQAAMLVIAAVRPIDAWWVVALATTAVSTVVLLVGAPSQGVRKLQAASGPPERSVLVILTLLSAPTTFGLASFDPPTATTMVLALSAPLVGFWYSRLLPGGFYLIRYGWPGAALVLALSLRPAAAVVSVIWGLAVAVMAWHPSVRVAFYPPRQRGTAYPIPPELAPQEIRKAIQPDRRGRQG
jgi:hypothetical protein